MSMLLKKITQAKTNYFGTPFGKDAFYLDMSNLSKKDHALLSNILVCCYGVLLYWDPISNRVYLNSEIYPCGEILIDHFDKMGEICADPDLDHLIAKTVHGVISGFSNTNSSIERFIENESCVVQHVEIDEQIHRNFIWENAKMIA